MSWIGMLGILSAAFTVQPGGQALAVMCRCPAEAVAESEPIVRQGDWTVEGKQTYRDKHLRLDGTLILPEGTELVLERCTLEITGDYSREYSRFRRACPGKATPCQLQLGGSLALPIALPFAEKKEKSK